MFQEEKEGGIPASTIVIDAETKEGLQVERMRMRMRMRPEEVDVPAPTSLCP
jgi:hypothetical protein